MKLTDFISKKAIIPVLKAVDKKGCIQELVQAARKAFEGERFVVADIVDGIVQREKIGSTGIGGGVGVPHVKLEGIKNVIGAFGRVAMPIDFNAVDGAPVDLMFLILSPPSKGEAYLKALQKIMTAIKKPNFVKFLRGAKTTREIEEIFREVEEVAV
ncbi:MAG TPA: PTS sugar transporter subunit IIA [Planctomycetota bacterium]|nr:PTS sugar transporter subunit IIA [Planctomycetota bacterium]